VATNYGFKQIKVDINENSISVTEFGKRYLPMKDIQFIAQNGVSRYVVYIAEQGLFLYDSEFNTFMKQYHLTITKLESL
jgi:hypothetical protein